MAKCLEMMLRTTDVQHLVIRDPRPCVTFPKAVAVKTLQT